MDKAEPFGVIEVDIAPRAEADRAALLTALDTLATDDPDFAYAVDLESGEIRLLGMDEPQLDAKVEALSRIHRIDFRLGAPQVAYRETVGDLVRIDYTHKKLAGEFARVIIIVTPRAYTAGNSFESRLASDTLPEDFMHAAKKGALEVLQSGVLGGFPVVGVATALADGAYHGTDSSPLAFEIAARAAVREALQRTAMLLEPIMKVVVSTPETFAHAVVRDLKSRRGEIREQTQRGDWIDVTAIVPVANLFGYRSSLHALTDDKGSYRSQFDHYAPVPTPDDPPFRPAIGMRA